MNTGEHSLVRDNSLIYIILQLEPSHIVCTVYYICSPCCICKYLGVIKLKIEVELVKAFSLSNRDFVELSSTLVSTIFLHLTLMFSGNGHEYGSNKPDIHNRLNIIILTIE